MENVIQKLIDAGEEGESWGSCQYDTAASAFATLMTMEVGDVMVALNIIGKPRDVNDFLFSRYIHARLQNISPDESDWEYLTTQYDSINDNYPRQPKYAVVSMFKACECASWDLWSAAPFIADICFIDLDLSFVPANTKTKGPMLNQLCQSENIKVAVCCYLLTKFGFVHDTEPFTDFCT
jgi:hypothetical protein